MGVMSERRNKEKEQRASEKKANENTQRPKRKKLSSEDHKEAVAKRIQKKNVAAMNASKEKRANKITKNQNIKKQQEKNFLKYTPKSLDEMNKEIQKYKEKHRSKKPKIIPKTPKKAPKKLNDTTNGLAFNFKGNKKSSQTYTVKPLKNGGYVLQTNILGIPTLSKKEVRELRIAAGIETTRKRRNRINGILQDIIDRDNKTDSLSIEMAFDKNYILQNVQVGAYSQMTERNFRNKEFIQKHIDYPMADETFTQFNNIIGFCKGKLDCYKDENTFISYLKNQESIKKNHHVNNPLTPEEMIHVLKDLGHEYTSDKKITPDDFERIQKSTLHLSDDDVISPFHKANLSADYMLKALRCITNESITEYFVSEAKDISHFEYTINPKNKVGLKKSIAPITNPTKDPRATLNAVILRHFIDNKEPLFRKKQMEHIKRTGIENNFKWNHSKKKIQKPDTRNHLKIVA